MSPEVGVLDEDALRDALKEQPDEALALVADLMSATDEKLRAAAQRLAARLIIDRARVGTPTRRGTGRPVEVSAERGGDLDIDASVPALSAARAERRPPSLTELRAREWGRPALALCLLVDHSGSMNGKRLATAAVTAAACALQAPEEFALVVFARDTRVVKSLAGAVPAHVVADEVLRLRGHGMTAVASALRTASAELAPARAARRVTILLSDCRATDDEDPIPAARGTEELIVLAPDDDADQARELARSCGAAFAALDGPDSAPRLLEALLAGQQV